MNVLGIESSCDETSISIISENDVKANLVSSQDFHNKYGGVVPELSSRAHLQIMLPLLKDALERSGLKLSDIDVISATAGPGLIGAVLVGLSFAKALSYSLRKPFIPVNHIEGHIYSPFLSDEKPEFPYLSLIVSGGHTLLLIVKNDLEIIKLGGTIDDAAGEAFDKGAKTLGLGYPGGPIIQKISETGNKTKIDFPIANVKGKYDFSFSGVKTALLRFVQKNYKNLEEITPNDLSDIAASYQESIVKALKNVVEKTLDDFSVKSVSVAGGVAANKAVREAFMDISERRGLKLSIPDLKFCGDNAAMIAYRGARLFENGKNFSLQYPAFPSLEENSFLSLEYISDAIKQAE